MSKEQKVTKISNSLQQKYINTKHGTNLPVKTTEILILQGTDPTEITLYPLKTKYAPNEKPFREIESDIAPCKKIWQSEPVIGTYHSHPIKINSRQKSIYEFSCYIRAKSPDTTYSLTIALKDDQGNYLDRVVEKGWFHWDYPVLFKKASAIWPNEPEKIVYSITPGLIPEEAKFMQLGLVLNHKSQKVVYQVCGLYLKKVQ